MEIHQVELLDTLIKGYKCSGSMNGFKVDHNSISASPKQNLESGFKLGQPSSDQNQSGVLLPNGPNPSNLVQSPGTSSEVDSPDEHDITDAVLKYISQMLMEEDMESKPCMFQDCLALHAAEKSFYDVLGEKYPPVLDSQCRNVNFTSTSSGHSSSSSAAVDNFVESNLFPDRENRDKYESSFPEYSHVDYNSDFFLQSFDSSNSFSDGAVDSHHVAPFQVPDSYVESQLVEFLQYEDLKNPYADPNEKNSKVLIEAERNGKDHSPNGSRGKKNHYREDNDYVEGGRSSKQLAGYTEESDEEPDIFDEVLLCPKMNPHLRPEHTFCPDGDSSHNAKKQGNRANVGRPRGKKQGNTKEVVDLETLLTQCAQAVVSSDSRSANELLNKIRQHSSPHGNGTERLAHYFANALEKRLAGAGTALYTVFASPWISAADIVKGYRAFIKSCPFKLLSNFYANRSIAKVSRKATRLHIIDFGVLYGFQWPCLIQRLSARQGGPPQLRITGIEFPQPGFRPAERVEETGRRLAKYCERFNVPFEYNAIAKKWDTIQLEDLNIDPDEVLVVNCLYRLRNVPDDTVASGSPRDTVLNLIRRINPNLFIHGVVNGMYSAPFFVARFREALFHFSALFDMFEAALPREDQDRMLFEKEIFGRDVMNVIACEGSERVERPEPYKQWQVRNMRAGFRQLPLDREIVEEVRDWVRRRYNKDFAVDEDGNWMLQGWKGRIVVAISCWKPAKEC